MYTSATYKMHISGNDSANVTNAMGHVNPTMVITLYVNHSLPEYRSEITRKMEADFYGQDAVNKHADMQREQVVEMLRANPNLLRQVQDELLTSN